ncbi:MAG: oligosaccharide flippase family protein [Paramuribaculum sp.]|nr:oligosaccharide flippase family protein [Paramuribaculum sp.]
MGGTQIVHILMTLIKGKIVALFVGLAGTGLSSIYWTATSWIQQLASAGLPLAAVKDIAKEHEKEKRDFLISLIKRFFSVAALCGAVICLLLSPILSFISFADYGHTLDFVYLSLLVWFAVKGAGELTLLQGLNQVKPLYRASIVGSVTGVLTGLPFYWLLGMKGIVWALIIASAATFLSLKFYTSRVVKVRISPFRTAWDNRGVISGTLKSGIVLFIGGIMTAVSNFIVISFVRGIGGIDDVGSYQSAYNIIWQISAVVFAAMSVDYYPRLSRSEAEDMNTLVENQIFIGVGLTVPIMCLVMAFSEIAVKILLTDEFLLILPVLKWFSFAMVIKAVSYPLGYIALAKANRRLYFKLEVVALNVLNLTGLVAGFYFGGLIGLGIALSLIYSIDILIYVTVCRRLFGLKIGWKLPAFVMAGLLYTGLMLAVSLAEPENTGKTAPYIVAALSLIFPAILMKIRREEGKL